MNANKGIWLVLIGVLGELGILYFVHQSIGIDASILAARVQASDKYHYVTPVSRDIWNIIQTKGYMNFVILFAIIIIIGLYICTTDKNS